MALSERAGKRDDTTPRTWLITGVSSGFGRELADLAASTDFAPGE